MYFKKRFFLYHVFFNDFEQSFVIIIVTIIVTIIVIIIVIIIVTVIVIIIIIVIIMSASIEGNNKEVFFGLKNNFGGRRFLFADGTGLPAKINA